MSKMILISDLHLLTTNLNSRKDSIIESQWEKLDYIFRIAETLNACVVQAGDFVDSPRSWVLTGHLMNFFSRHSTVPVFFIKGQHDVYFRSTSLTTMGVLTMIFPTTVHLLETKPYIVGEVALVGQSYMEKSVKYPHTKGKFNILVIHKPITNKKLPYKVSSAKSFLRKNEGFDCILCGDIHRKFHIKLGNRHILNTSSLIRKTRLDSPPSFCILDTKLGTYDFRDVPIDTDVFIDTKEKEDVNFVDEFIEKVKKASFLEFTPREKVLKLVEEKHSSLRDLAISIMGRD